MENIKKDEREAFEEALAYVYEHDRNKDEYKDELEIYLLNELEAGRTAEARRLIKEYEEAEKAEADGKPSAEAGEVKEPQQTEERNEVNIMNTTNTTKKEEGTNMTNELSKKIEEIRSNLIEEIKTLKNKRDKLLNDPRINVDKKLWAEYWAVVHKLEICSYELNKLN